MSDISDRRSDNESDTMEIVSCGTFGVTFIKDRYIVKVPHGREITGILINKLLDKSVNELITDEKNKCLLDALVKIMPILPIEDADRSFIYNLINYILGKIYNIQDTDNQLIEMDINPNETIYKIFQSYFENKYVNSDVRKIFDDALEQANFPDMMEEDMIKEIKILKELHKETTHANIIKYIDLKDKKFSVQLGLLRCQGTLKKINLKETTIEKQNNILRNIGYQLLSAIHFIHEKGYCHCDIKCDNITYVRGDDNSILIQLIDFGGALTLEQVIDGQGITKGYTYMTKLIALSHGYNIQFNKFKYYDEDTHSNLKHYFDISIFDKPKVNEIKGLLNDEINNNNNFKDYLKELCIDMDVDVALGVLYYLYRVCINSIPIECSLDMINSDYNEQKKTKVSDLIIQRREIYERIRITFERINRIEDRKLNRYIYEFNTNEQINIIDKHIINKLLLIKVDNRKIIMEVFIELNSNKSQLIKIQLPRHIENERELKTLQEGLYDERLTEIFPCIDHFINKSAGPRTSDLKDDLGRYIRDLQHGLNIGDKITDDKLQQLKIKYEDLSIKEHFATDPILSKIILHTDINFDGWIQHDELDNLTYHDSLVTSNRDNKMSSRRFIRKLVNYRLDEEKKQAEEKLTKAETQEDKETAIQELEVIIDKINKAEKQEEKEEKEEKDAYNKDETNKEGITILQKLLVVIFISLFLVFMLAKVNK